MTPSEARRTPGELAPTPGGCRCRYLVTLSQGLLGHALNGFIDIGITLFHRLHIQPALPAGMLVQKLQLLELTFRGRIDDGGARWLELTRA